MYLQYTRMVTTGHMAVDWRLRGVSPRKQHDDELAAFTAVKNHKPLTVSNCCANEFSKVAL